MTERRKKGSGSIIHLQDGTILVRLNKQERRVRSQAEAERKLVEMQHLAEQGQRLPDARRTVAHWLTDWLARHRLGIEASTYAMYEVNVRVHLIPRLGHLRLVDLKEADVDRLFLTLLQKDELAPGTVGTVRQALNVALEAAVREGVIHRNVVRYAHKLRRTRTGHPTLEPSEARLYLEVARPHRLFPLFELLLTCGLRLGEARALRWGDCDLGEGTVWIRRSLYRNRETHAVEVKVPKTPSSWRTVDLPPTLVDHLREHRMRQADEREVAGDDWQEDPDFGDLVFRHPLGTPVMQPQVNFQHHRMREAAGLSHFSVRDLRSICTSLMAAGGVPLKVAMDRLGHHDSKVTLEIYTEVLGSQRREAAEKMEMLLQDRVGDKVGEFLR